MSHPLKTIAVNSKQAKSYKTLFPTSGGSEMSHPLKTTAVNSEQADVAYLL